MDRLYRLLVVLWATLATAGLCFQGVEPAAEPLVQAREAETLPDHAQRVGLPDPSPAVAGERDEDPRGAVEDDDDLAHGPRDHLVVLAPRARRIQRLRGPPTATRATDWRPRSSRGPPTRA